MANFFVLTLWIGLLFTLPHSQAVELYETSARYKQQNSYSIERQTLHRSILYNYLNCYDSPNPSSPMILFTGGAPGAGKSTVLRKLMELDLIAKNNFMIVDPDKIKLMIPEYKLFQAIDPTQAASLVHPESRDINNQLIQLSLLEQKNLIVEGTLKNPEATLKVLQAIRVWYPSYFIVLLAVDAKLQTALKRMVQRGKKTGRYVPETAVHAAQQQLPASLIKLTPYADALLFFSNETQTQFEFMQVHGVTYKDPQPLVKKAQLRLSLLREILATRKKTLPLCPLTAESRRRQCCL